MGKFARSLALLGMTAGLVAVAGVGAVAQDKKADKTKTDKTKVEKGLTVEINEGKDGKFRFNIRNTADNKLVAMSALTGFATKEDAEKALDALKEGLPAAKVVVGKKADK